MTSKPPNLVITQSPLLAASAAADIFAKIITQSREQRVAFNVCLSGGKTPATLYHLLADGNYGLNWNRMEIFFGDERNVAIDHEDSNYHLAKTSLLDAVDIPPESIHPIHGDAADLSAEAAEYENIIREIVPPGDDGLPQFDIILLGLGVEGHTASIFPDSPAIAETQKLVVAGKIPALGRDRISITFPLINAAANVIILATGKEKSAAVRKLVCGKRAGGMDIPACGINPSNGKLHIVVDADASAMLP